MGLADVVKEWWDAYARRKRIKEAAILWTDGKVYTAELSAGKPGRHHDVIRHMVFDLGIKPPVNRIQGFVTEDGEFVDRREGAKIAIAVGQVKPEAMQDKSGEILYSEDLY